MRCLRICNENETKWLRENLYRRKCNFYRMTKICRTITFLKMTLQELSYDNRT